MLLLKRKIILFWLKNTSLTQGILADGGSACALEVRAFGCDYNGYLDHGAHYNGYPVYVWQLCPATCNRCETYFPPECIDEDLCCCEDDARGRGRTGGGGRAGAGGVVSGAEGGASGDAVGGAPCAGGDGGCGASQGQDCKPAQTSPTKIASAR